MATIINNPDPDRRVIEREVDSGAGWMVAIVILVVLILLGIFLWPRLRQTAPATDNGGTNVNVSIPGSGTDNGSNGSGSGTDNGNNGSSSGNPSGTLPEGSGSSGSPEQ